jgi:GT2 family glycosyltransferase
VDYSIIIPVFNKADLTKNCLEKLRPSLDGAGLGEVIVIDNASTDHTTAVLAQFPWIRCIRNEKNLGFAAANNQGARIARGRHLVLLNNDTEPITAWLAPMLQLLADPAVGVVGARLLFPDKTIQHAGVVVRSAMANGGGFIPYHYLAKHGANDPGVTHRRDFQIVTGACMATPRDLYLELGGLDEGFWNGFEDVDYCLKVRERGLRVVYEPQASLLHFESQSGVQRFRRAQANVARLALRWKDRVQIDAPVQYTKAGVVHTHFRYNNGAVINMMLPPTPVRVVVHGATAQTDRPAFEQAVRANGLPIESIQWPEPGREIEAVREAMTVRGERSLAIVRADSRLHAGWLDELVARAYCAPNIAAATFAGGPVAGNAYEPAFTSDARCVVLRLRAFPQHMAIEDSATLDGAVADLLARAIPLRSATIRVYPALAEMGAPSSDAGFEERHGMRLEQALSQGRAAIEARFRARTTARRGLVSIVMLSWNAPKFTIDAVRSIVRHTPEPYEIIIVDNGSGQETLDALATIDDPHVRIVYNPTNRGFSGGNNDGIAHANGDYVILLNNDVLVTPNWTQPLMDAFARIPNLGIAAPRTNNITGDQRVVDANYASEDDMLAYAARRAEEYAGKGYLTDRAIGFCWCISRAALEAVGALDEQYSLGNFEDDDYCLRMRAAGYAIYVCDDAFIHHFGSQSFIANKVDYARTMQGNWEKFARKWGFPGALPSAGYNSVLTYLRGFDPRKHFIPLPNARRNAHAEPAETNDRTVLGLVVRSERDWQSAAQFVRRYASAFRLADGVALSIAATGDLDARTLALRVEKLLEKAGVTAAESGNIYISDVEAESDWRESHPGLRWVDVDALGDRSPSALRRLLAEATA